MTTATLRTVGNSVAVVIPKQWLSVLKIDAGSQVELLLDGEQLTLKPATKTSRKKYKLAELLAECDDQAPYPEELQDWDNAPSMGREAW